MPIFKVPEESEFLQHFSVEPEKSAPKDGYWCYEFKDVSETVLRISFNVHEHSLQTILLKGGYELSRVCQEGATLLAIINMGGKKVLRGECEFRDAKTTVEIVVEPRISVAWSTLRTE